MTSVAARLRALSHQRIGLLGRAAIALTVALLGFLLATQLRVQESLGDRLAIESEADLARILSDLGLRADNLLQEIGDLRVQLARARGSAQQEEILVANARDELASMQVLIGSVPVRGPGIVLRIDDPQESVTADVLLDVVQELRDAGAEAIEVNGVRVVASTAFGSSAGRLRAGGQDIAPPYLVRAIGERGTLAEAMRIPGGVVDAVSSRVGASVRIAQHESMRIASLHRARPFSYARPD